MHVLPLHPELGLSHSLGFIWYKCIENLFTGKKFEGGFPGNPNSEYKSPELGRGLSLPHETFSEAHLPLLVSIRMQ